jgi:NAD+ diphosphatase
MHRQIHASTMPPELGFAGSLLDRCANHRSDEAWLAKQWAAPSSRLILLDKDKARLAGGRIIFAPCSGEAILLGRDAEGAIFAAETPSPFEDGHDLRSIAAQGLLPPPDQAILAQARSMLLWHQRHGFCANCGTKSELKDAGYRRHCPSCLTDHFPRTDPVIIIVARHRGRALLGRQKAWPPGMYSALAGFMEPGETIEEAARREVFEEAGVRLGAVHYLKSQPWPFPSSLMIGLIGEALSDAITLDEKELEHARWFTREELQLMKDRAHPEGFFHPLPMAIAHHLILAAIDDAAKSD